METESQFRKFFRLRLSKSIMYAEQISDSFRSTGLSHLKLRNYLLVPINTWMMGWN